MKTISKKIFVSIFFCVFVGRFFQPAIAFGRDDYFAWDIGIVFWLPNVVNASSPQPNGETEDLRQQLEEIQNFKNGLDQSQLPIRVSVFINRDPVLENGSQRLLAFVDQFIQKSYQREKTADFSGGGTKPRTALFFYGHGEGPTGLRYFPLSLSKKIINKFADSQMGLEWVWFDSCYLASIEWAAEWNKITSHFVASEGPLFSAGSPYDFLRLLSLPLHYSLDTPSLLKMLLTEAMASYSYQVQGSQTHFVQSSPATLSWIYLPHLVQSLGTIKQLAEFHRSLKNFSQFDSVLQSLNTSLLENEILPGRIDLGILLSSYWNSLWSLSSPFQLGDFNNPSLVHQTEQLFKTLYNFYPHASSQFFESESGQPYRIEIPLPSNLNVPREHLRLVIGYEGFTRGHSQDFEWRKGFSKENQMTPYTYYFFQNKWWPVLVPKLGSQNGVVYLFPFTPQTRLFQSFWVYEDPSSGNLFPISNIASFYPRQDFVSYFAKTENQVIRYFGYTQSTNPSILQWSGLSILSPFSSDVSVDYFDLFFTQNSNWGPH